jgi:hypothetical protein
MRVAVRVLPRQLHRVQQLPHLRPPLRFGHLGPVHGERLRDALPDRQLRVERRRRVLEHEPDPLPQRLERAFLRPHHLVAQDGE